MIGLTSSEFSAAASFPAPALFFMLLLADLLVSCLHTEEKITDFILVGSQRERTSVQWPRLNTNTKTPKNAEHQHQSNNIFIRFTSGPQQMNIYMLTPKLPDTRTVLVHLFHFNASTVLDP